MTRTDNRRDFEKSWSRKKIDAELSSWGDEPLSGADEMRTAWVAWHARAIETAAGAIVGLLAFAALGVALISATSLSPVTYYLVLAGGVLTVFGSLHGCYLAGVAAAVQAIAENRQAVKLATTSSAPPEAVRGPERASTVTMTLGTIAAFAGAVLLTTVIHRRGS